MDKRIVVVSDSHGNQQILKDILLCHPHADLYLHLGDSEESLQNIYPFISVKGNNDYFIEEETKIVTIDDLKIYMTHGHKMHLSKENMVARANLHHCNAFFYGHTHVPFYEYYKGIYLLNPGSLAYPRSSYGKTYAIIDLIQDHTVNVEIKSLEKNY